ncbi:MAG: GntR family transcriptional regulator [Pseudomonadota bacterium]
MTKSTPNSQRALQELRRRIFEGELPAGSDHLESELADQLGMSRTPVREAVLMLESQGLLAMRPRKGVRILPVSPEDMSEIYDVLTELESLAAERAAEAGYTHEELHDLAKAIDKMDAALDRSDLEAWAAADDLFHAELVRIGGNRRVVMIAAMMTDQVRRARNTTLYMRPRPTKSNDDHRRVLDAIAHGDAQTARSLHRLHREEAKAMIIDLLHKHRLRFL